jgi:hypothetical protein
MDDSFQKNHDDRARDKFMSAHGRADNLDTKLWASGIFESTPYGYFNKMMESKISEVGAKTLHSHIHLDHYNIEKVCTYRPERVTFIYIFTYLYDHMERKSDTDTKYIYIYLV